MTIDKSVTERDGACHGNDKETARFQIGVARIGTRCISLEVPNCAERNQCTSRTDLHRSNAGRNITTAYPTSRLPDVNRARTSKKTTGSCNYKAVDKFFNIISEL